MTAREFVQRPTYAEEFQNLRDNVHKVIVNNEVMEKWEQISCAMSNQGLAKNDLQPPRLSYGLEDPNESRTPKFVPFNAAALNW